MKILWIEDEANVIKYVISPLKRDGYIFDIAESYGEFENFKEKLNEYSLVILDLILPEKNSGPPFDYVGRKILNEINQTSVNIPIIIFTVIDENNSNEELEKQKNVCFVLHKPISSKELLDAVIKVINNKEY